MIKIYTDGSCLGNPGNGGWAAIIIKQDKKIKIKNPREYIQKLKVHNKFSNFKNYYN